ncbi:MAG TPA: glycosyltransferase family 39 protein [Candidatus Hydrogenedentes bacterium]|nr:glycosyltransferase family 39 protein [Candidatus Hydrogenedentota bacterium]
MTPPPAHTPEPFPSPAARHLAAGAAATLALWFAGMLLLWEVGVESIYGHPTPFYALFAPALPGKAGATGIALCLALGTWALRRSAAAGMLADPSAPAPAHSARFLTGVVVFLALFACVVAAVRGLHGIAQAYQREAYEVIGDIGKAPSIRAFFGRYLSIHPYLSMHGKVHPPGPAALLWTLSYVVTNSAAALSLATVAVASLAVFPLYGWVRELFGPRTAAVAVLLYAVTPGVVLFTATSADALFPPFTLAALWLFQRALRGGRPAPAAAAGVAFACASLLKFSLLGLGAWFALCGLALLPRRDRWGAVFRTAAVMFAAFLAVHIAVRLWSGFDYVAAFQAAKAQFDTDQHHLDELDPRYPGWTFRVFFNPATWFYFAGIPVSLLFLGACARPGRAAREPGGEEALFPPRTVLVLLVLGALALNFLYLARGEGERSALYLYPFLIAPAAHALAGICERERRAAALWTVLAFLAGQTLLTEMLFYTYW